MSAKWKHGICGCSHDLEICKYSSNYITKKEPKSDACLSEFECNDLANCYRNFWFFFGSIFLNEKSLLNNHRLPFHVHLGDSGVFYTSRYQGIVKATVS